MRGGHQSRQSVEGERNVLRIKSACREKESSRLFGGELGVIAEHRRSLFELVPSKGFAGVRTETALPSGELTG